eukprot:3752306-Alexandrium_andersonii.AAC.1
MRRLPTELARLHRITFEGRRQEPEGKSGRKPCSGQGNACTELSVNTSQVMAPNWWLTEPMEWSTSMLKDCRRELGQILIGMRNWMQRGTR